MEENCNSIIGTFVHCLYRSDSYMVTKFNTNEGIVTVTSNFFEYEENTKYELFGYYTNHPKYGYQFHADSMKLYISNEKEEIISFLCSNLFKGIGKAAANKIYSKFGKETLSILKENPSMIENVSLNQKQKLAILEGFQKLNDPEGEVMFYLASNGFTHLESSKIYSRFHFTCIEIAKDNPFRFYNEVDGIRFDKVKAFASKFEFEESELKFEEAYMIYLLKDYCFNTGNLYIENDSFFDKWQNELKMSDFSDVLERAIHNGYLIQEESRIYLKSDYEDETFIANRMMNFLKFDNKPVELLDEAILECEKEFSIAYDEKQKEAIYHFFDQNVSLIVGGPGTGKTTIVKTMVKIYQSLFPFSNLIVVAPTGRAAKRVSEICDCEAKTIHSLLRWDLETNIFVFDEGNPIAYDAIIIDEFSMVDNNLFSSLLRASKNVKKLCIIGDDQQLPSIRPGNVLRDLIDCNIFPMTTLVSNYRQNKGSEIIDLANSIIKDNLDLSIFHEDITFLDSKKQNINIIELINKDIAEGYCIHDIQVLAPMYRGVNGIDSLNIALQNAFNPSSSDKKEKTFNRFTFKEGDKVIQLKNRPTDDVYNGDIGIIEEIDLLEKCIIVNYQGTIVFYNFEDLDNLSLAYALSVHKAQGSEYPIVYFVFSKDNRFLLSKNLIYTAISRAKVKLVLIGEENILNFGLKQQINARKTSLVNRIKMTTL